MHNNVYILSLQFGYEHQEGFYYHDLKTFLESNDVKFTFQFEFNFKFWFTQAFFHSKSEDKANYYKYIGSNKGDVTKLFLESKLPFDRIDDDLSFIRGESIIQYLDYLELQEARKNANSARKFSMWSIRIAALAFIVSAVSLFAPYIWPYPTTINTPNNSKAVSAPSFRRPSFLVPTDSSQNSPDTTHFSE